MFFIIKLPRKIAKIEIKKNIEPKIKTDLKTKAEPKVKIEFKLRASLSIILKLAD